MKITVLSDNTACGELLGEWGLSLYIEYEGHRYLLDTGASGLFAQNARKLGIDLSSVDAAVLSHAHYDHTLGLSEFFALNPVAPVYLSADAGENCYGGKFLRRRYIGLPAGVLADYSGRFIRPLGVVEIGPGVALVPHSTPGLGRLGRRNRLWVRKGWRYVPDDFSHEQTLVFSTASGLVLFNSCSHSGPEVVVSEVLRAFPGSRVAAYVGGLHLFRLNDAEVCGVADRLESCGVGKIYTGHCTGDKAYGILKSRFGDCVEQFCCGKEIIL